MFSTVYPDATSRGEAGRISLVVALVFLIAATGSGQDTPHPTPTWQDAMAKGLVPYHQLRVDDFPINDKAHPKNSFYIRNAIAPQYHFILKSENGFVYASIDQWLIFAGFDKTGSDRKSAFKKMAAELPYVQGLLDLSEIHARKIAALRPGELPNARGNTPEEARAELVRKLQEFLASKYKESENEGEAFMKATDHGANKKKVKELAGEIRKRLEATPATTVPFPEPSAAAISPSASPSPATSPASSAPPTSTPAPSP